MKITQIAFTCYAVSDIKKARAFYEGVLGLTSGSDFPPTEESQFVEYEIGNGTLAIGCSPDWKPSSDGASAALEVEDFDAVLAELKKKNISVFSGPHVFPSCSMVVLKDPDGNKVTLHKRKEK